MKGTEKQKCLQFCVVVWTWWKGSLHDRYFVIPQFWFQSTVKITRIYQYFKYSKFLFCTLNEFYTIPSLSKVKLLNLWTTTSFHIIILFTQSQYILNDFTTKPKNANIGFYLYSPLGLHKPAAQHRLDLPICQLAVGHLDLPLYGFLQQQTPQTPVEELTGCLPF